MHVVNTSPSLKNWFPLGFPVYRIQKWQLGSSEKYYPTVCKSFKELRSSRISFSAELNCLLGQRFLRYLKYFFIFLIFHVHNLIVVSIVEQQEFKNIAQLNCFKILAKQPLKSNSCMCTLLLDLLKMSVRDCVVSHHYNLEKWQYPFLLP